MHGHFRYRHPLTQVTFAQMVGLFAVVGWLIAFSIGLALLERHCWSREIPKFVGCPETSSMELASQHQLQRQLTTKVDLLLAAQQHEQLSSKPNTNSGRALNYKKLEPMKVLKGLATVLEDSMGARALVPGDAASAPQLAAAI